MNMKYVVHSHLASESLARDDDAALLPGQHHELVAPDDDVGLKCMRFIVKHWGSVLGGWTRISAF